MRAFGLVVFSLLYSLSLSALGAEPAAGPDNATCLGCHGSPGMSAERPDKSKRSLSVDAAALAGSVHGKGNQCLACHAAQAEVPHTDVSKSLADWRRRIPEICANCHAKQTQEYGASTHAKAAVGGSTGAPVCSDCHSAHAIARVQGDAARLASVRICSSCHADQLKSYAITSHGKIATLGYAQTATCSDCHGAHAALRINPAGVLATCRQCHSEAPAGFASYQSHATTDDFARYPQMWLAFWFMVGLLAFTFGLFWTHSVLWLYAEWRDRRERKLRPHVRAEAVAERDRREVQRWSPAWRFAHLVFTVSVIFLVATAIPLLYPSSAWAPWLIGLFGGPAAASTVHKWAAVIMLVVFAGHLVYVAVWLVRNWKTFKVFGPYSLMPNWQDAKDVVAMCKWFVGKGPRPVCDHWNYMQKVDYWAPFWGIAMLTWTGFMLWFKELNAAYLPGWTLNVATLVHGEEALLAAVYLFTIHFFVNHWRPDKFPMDLVIFTGSMPMEEFQREYSVEYRRLKESGELDKYLVNEPARPMTLFSKLLGFALVAVGLVLLVMMVTGFVGRLAGV